MKSSSSKFWENKKQPIIEVSWFGAKKFCERLNEQANLPEGYIYRLPTEAEWEYACRAGTETKYYNGNKETDLAKASWYYDNSGDQTHPVGKKEPNAFGLYDMHGNVYEWCEDKWHGNYEGAPKDGSAWTRSDDSRRLLRGGSWCLSARRCRSARRNNISQRDTENNISFRVVLAVP